MKQDKEVLHTQGETTDEKVELALKQNDKMYNENEKKIFKAGYIYGEVRANEEGCVWGLEQGKKENAKLLAENKSLKEQLETGANQYGKAIADNYLLETENKALKDEVKNLSDSAILDLAFNPLKEENKRLLESNRELVEALKNILNHQGDAEQGLHTYINELNEIAKQAIDNNNK